ncbi:putative bifunctional diguanylate cyclase/phosphodiesterase [Bounagaea algeriensis]
MQSEPRDADWFPSGGEPGTNPEGPGTNPEGNVADRDFLDLALALNDAVLWVYSFSRDEMRWVSPGLEQLLAIPGATTEQQHARLRELASPLIVSARTAPVWRELELERSFESPDGGERAVRFRARRTRRDDRGGEEELRGVVTDTSEAHHDRRELADLAERYRLLTELTPVAICVHQDGVITYVNSAAVDLVEADSDADVLERPITEFLGAAAVPALRERIDELDTPGATSPPTEVTVNRFDGNTVLIESVSVRIMWRGRPAYQVILRDITEQRAAEDQLRYQAEHDELTGLLNRTGVNDVLAELTGVQRRQTALLFCDIDNFKRINDSLGHEAGDELLTTLAHRLVQEVPPECSVARISGDEFLVVCPGVGPGEELDRVATLVSESLRTVVPVREELVSVSASTGAAVFEGGMTGQDLLRYADMAMFHAKSRGPGRVSLANPALISAVEAQVHLEGQLREAMRTDQLALYFQPIVDTDGTVVELEALLRWPHPERGLLAPDTILPVAQQADLLRELDCWVLRTALTEAAQWPGDGARRPAVAVNLARLLPTDPHFFEDVTAIIAGSGISPERVVLEMVETELVELTTVAHRAMAELAERGVRFAIDDFGTGYSSLARLKDIPAQTIKLDRRFVASVDDDTVDHAIARAVIDIAGVLERTCVAEGVETTSQLRTLAELGVDLYQGYLFSRPLPAAELRAGLQRER